jgi:hypothetical protein
MKKTTNNSQPKHTESLMDFFPDPRTIPPGWDLSEMFTPSEAGYRTDAEAKTTEETGNDICPLD